MVLEQAVVDGRLAKNPAEYVKLPTGDRHQGRQGRRSRGPGQFLTPAQVSALVDATPWPYNVLVHVAAWAGLRAAELGGLTIANVELPDPPLNPNAPAKPGVLRVQQAARANGAAIEYGPLKTKQSYRRVPLTAETHRVAARLPRPAPTRRRTRRPAVPRYDADDGPGLPECGRHPPTRSGHYGCGRGSAEHHREGPRATAGRSPGRTHRGGRGEAAGARLDPAATPRDVLQGGVSPSGVARQQAYADREAVTRISPSTRCATRTRACALRRASGPSTSRS